jgi:dihydropteroate synthase
MREAAKLGAGLINDVRALQKEDALDTLFDVDLPVCIVHMLGEPQTMQLHPQYENIILDITNFFKQRIVACAQAGIAGKKIILDPGFGFGKTLEHNVQLIRSLDAFKDLNCPILIGVSRKAMIQAITGRPIEQRLAGGLALAVIAAIKGANIIRVHDVKETADALKVYEAIFTNAL